MIVDHAAKLFDALRDERLYTFMPEDPPQSLDKLAKRYAALSRGQSSDGSEIWLNWPAYSQSDGCYVGIIQATVRKDQTALLAYQVFPAFWRQGLAVEACRRVIDHLTKAYGVTAIEALIDTRNLASIGLAEKLGMTLIETITEADYFKGARSDEFHYRLHLT